METCPTADSESIMTEITYLKDARKNIDVEHYESSLWFYRHIANRTEPSNQMLVMHSRAVKLVTFDSGQM